MSSLQGTVARLSVAGEWFHQGLWCKVLGQDPSHERIVESVPGLTADQARLALKALGFIECGVGLWVLSRKKSTACAVVQTAMVLGMNASGLLFAKDEIPNAKKLLARNTAFLGLVWAAR